MTPIGWSLVLLVAALVLFLAEIIIPSGGVLTVLGGGAVIGSVVMAFLAGPLIGVAAVLGELLLLGLLAVLIVRCWPHTPIGRRILIARPQLREAAVDDPYLAELDRLQGRCGVAKSKLLPAGQIEIDGRRYEALSDGEAVEQGQPVVVLSRRRRSLVVRRLEDDDPRLDADSRPTTIPDAPQTVLDQPLESFGLEPLDELGGGDPSSSA